MFVESKCEHMSYDTIHKKTAIDKKEGLRPEEVDYLVQRKVLKKRRGKRRSYALGKTGEAMRAEALWAAEQQRQIASQRETHAQQREPVFEGIRAEAERAGRARLEQRLSSGVCVAPPDADETAMQALEMVRRSARPGEPPSEHIPELCRVAEFCFRMSRELAEVAAASAEDAEDTAKAYTAQALVEELHYWLRCVLNRYDEFACFLRETPGMPKEQLAQSADARAGHALRKLRERFPTLWADIETVCDESDAVEIIE